MFPENILQLALNAKVLNYMKLDKLLYVEL